MQPEINKSESVFLDLSGYHLAIRESDGETVQFNPVTKHTIVISKLITVFPDNE